MNLMIHIAAVTQIRLDTQRHSGAGRFEIVRMRTMTLSEKQATSPAVSVAELLDGDSPAPAKSPLQVRDYLHHITVGGWPLLAGADETTARTFLDGYLDVIVDRDIDEVSGGPRNPRLVRRFLYAYSQMVSHPASLNAIMRRARDEHDAGSAPAAHPGSTAVPSRHTAEADLDALRRMMIIDEVPAWDPSVRSSKRLTITPKRHLGDPSLAAALLQMSPERMLTDLETTGFLFESLVAHDLRIYAEAAGATCLHYREAEGRLEVDYILETRDGKWVGVEVKLGHNEIDKAADSLRRLADRVPRAPKALVVITGTTLAYTRDDGVHVAPLVPARAPNSNTAVAVVEAHLQVRDPLQAGKAPSSFHTPIYTELSADPGQNGRSAMGWPGRRPPSYWTLTISASRSPCMLLTARTSSAPGSASLISKLSTLSTPRHLATLITLLPLSVPGWATGRCACCPE